MFLMMACCLAACSKPKQQKYEKIEEILGTVITGKVYGKNAEEGLEAAFARAREIEHIMSAKEENSELSQLNKEAYQKEVSVSEELFLVIKKAIYYAKLADGNFDPTIGKLIDLWGIGTEHENVPKEKEIAPLTGLKDYEQVILDEEKRTVRFLTDTVQLDLGGIAKGYVADEMKEILTNTYGIESGTLSLGGNVMTIGNKTEGEQWVVGIADPLNPSSIIGTVQVTDKTVVTSGNYERYFIKNNVRYHHILNPETGYPANEGIISSTIITDCSMDADALSTAAYVMGAEDAIALIEKMEGIEAILVKEDGSIVSTDGAGFMQ